MSKHITAHVSRNRLHFCNRNDPSPRSCYCVTSKYKLRRTNYACLLLYLASSFRVRCGSFVTCARARAVLFAWQDFKKKFNYPAKCPGSAPTTTVVNATGFRIYLRLPGHPISCVPLKRNAFYKPVIVSITRRYKESHSGLADRTDQANSKVRMRETENEEESRK